MKVSVTIAVATLVLSTFAWSIFYVLDAPLKADETIVIVGFCAGIVFFVKWIFGRLRKKGS